MNHLQSVTSSVFEQILAGKMSQPGSGKSAVHPHQVRMTAAVFIACSGLFELSSRLNLSLSGVGCKSVCDIAGIRAAAHPLQAKRNATCLSAPSRCLSGRSGRPWGRGSASALPHSKRVFLVFFPTVSGCSSYFAHRCAKDSYA